VTWPSPFASSSRLAEPSASSPAISLLLASKSPLYGLLLLNKRAITYTYAAIVTADGGLRTPNPPTKTGTNRFAHMRTGSMRTGRSRPRFKGAK
jgi:hypothetical protein